jgi:plastocyanin domain-containing protein
MIIIIIKGHPMKTSYLALVTSLLAFLPAHYASAEQSADALSPAAQQDVVKKDYYEIIIKDHKFSPELLKVPAGEKIKLIIDNQDPTPEEFESHDFNREKIIPGNSKATIFIGPLKPGKYHFFGEFNMDTAKGDIIAE